MLKVGDTAPDFTAPTQDGDVHLHGLLATGPVILYFYYRDFTPACTAQAKKFRDMKDQLATTHAHVVGVSPDGVESHQNFVKQLVLGFPLAADPDKRIMKLFGVRSILGIVDRVTFVIDRQKVIRHVERSLLDVDRHAAAALETLMALERAAE
jgi:peroxiredoxin Q/BCP